MTTGTWQSNLSGLTIGVSYEGFSRAVVDCGRDQAAFVISMDEEFHGVVYTRGSYSNKNTACFRDAKGTKDFALKFPYDDCGMKLVSDVPFTVQISHPNNFRITQIQFSNTLWYIRKYINTKDKGTICVYTG